MLVGIKALRMKNHVQAWIKATASVTADEAQAPSQQSLKQKKMMSRSAWLAHCAVRKVMIEARWQANREEIGCFLGVGASGCETEDLTAILNASMEQNQFSIARFGHFGLAACNPLFAFHLMNNFTLCHSAILEGIGGPNSAFFSRGIGTVTALSEALYTLKGGVCRRALVGAADDARHPVTFSELRRNYDVSLNEKWTEASAILAISTERGAASIYVEDCHYYGVVQDESLASIKIGESDLLFIAPWGKVVRNRLRHFFGKNKDIIDITKAQGESLAATPAVAWVTAIRELDVRATKKKAVVISAGIDGGLGIVTFVKEALP